MKSHHYLLHYNQHLKYIIPTLSQLVFPKEVLPLFSAFHQQRQGWDERHFAWDPARTVSSYEKESVCLLVCLLLRLFFKVWHTHSCSHGQGEVPAISYSGSLSRRLPLHPARATIWSMFWILNLLIKLMENKGNYLILRKM